MDSHAGTESSSLAAYLRVLRRRKWLVLMAVVLVPAAAVGFSLKQKAKYEASAQVLLSRQSFANSLNNVSDPSFSIDPNRLPQTQADVARVPTVAQRTLAALHLTDRTPTDLLNQSTVSPSAAADHLTFTVS